MCYRKSALHSHNPRSHALIVVRGSKKHIVLIATYTFPSYLIFHHHCPPVFSLNCHFLSTLTHHPHFALIPQLSPLIPTVRYPYAPHPPPSSLQSQSELADPPHRDPTLSPLRWRQGLTSLCLLRCLHPRSSMDRSWKLYCPCQSRAWRPQSGREPRSPVHLGRSRRWRGWIGAVRRFRRRLCGPRRRGCLCPCWCRCRWWCRCWRGCDLSRGQLGGCWSWWWC